MVNRDLLYLLKELKGDMGKRKELGRFFYFHGDWGYKTDESWLLLNKVKTHA